MSVVTVEKVERIPSKDGAGKPITIVGYYLHDGPKKVPDGNQPAHLVIEQGQNEDREFLKLVQEYKKYKPQIQTVKG